MTQRDNANRDRSAVIGRLIKVICCVFLSLMPDGQAIFAKNQETIDFQANSVTYDYKKRIITYEGHVQGRQGTSTLAADRITVFYDAKDHIEKMTAVGRLASYHTLCHNNRDNFTATAKRMCYYPMTQRLELHEKASVQYNGSTFSGETLFYDLKNQAVNSQPKKKQPARIVLEPISNLKIKNE